MLGDKANWDPTFLWYANRQPVSSEATDTPNEVSSAPDTHTVGDNRVLTKYDMKTDIPNIVEEFTPCHNSRIVCKLTSGQALSCGLGPAVSSETSIHTLEKDRYQTPVRQFPPEDRICAISLSEADINRLELTAKFINRVVELSKLYNPDYTPETVSNWEEFTASFDQQTSDLAQFSNFPRPHQLAGKLLALRATNFDGSVLDNISKTSAYLAMAMALIPTAYGCVHLGALSIIFPTPVERLLWKVSCYYLIATAGATAVFSLVIYANELIYMVCQPHIEDTPISACRKWLRTTRRRWAGSAADMVDFILAGSIIAGLCLILFLYVGARLYVVIESFISLRHVPIGVYQTPSLNITGNVPHL
jgi:hypothetical protein